MTKEANFMLVCLLLLLIAPAYLDVMLVSSSRPERPAAGHGHPLQEKNVLQLRGGQQADDYYGKITSTNIGDNESGESSQPRAYAQWAAFHITLRGKGVMSLNNSELLWGKWYDYPNQDIEIAGPDGKTIVESQIVVVAASGRKNSPSGTEGSFDFYMDGTTRIGRLYFDCPWAGSNDFSVTPLSTRYIFQHRSVSLSGPIGDVNIDVIALS